MGVMACVYYCVVWFVMPVSSVFVGLVSVLVVVCVVFCVFCLCFCLCVVCVCLLWGWGCVVCGLFWCFGVLSILFGSGCFVVCGV